MEPKLQTVDGLLSKAANRNKEGTVTGVIALSELAKHNSKEDCWIAINGKVYDVTKWMDKHPGGMIPILDMAGQDATDVFAAFHPKRVETLLPAFLVGDLEPIKVAPLTMDHRAIVRQLEEAGMMETDPSFYYRLAGAIALFFPLVVAGVVLTESAALHMLCAVLLGMLWNQSSFIGHDTGHNSITRNRTWDSYIGLFVGNIFTGIGIQWWQRTHNVHHITCNSIEYDPDIQHIPIFAISPSFFSSRYSLYHFREMTFDAIASTLVQYQHLTFYPVMALARINLWIQTIILLVDWKKNVPWRKRELAGELLFVLWFGALIAALPNAWEKCGFFFISLAVGGILHVQICLSHFSMPTFEGRPGNDTFVQTQLAGTLDIDCPTWMDWFHGGLQFQAVHHLFPRMPRHNLRKASAIVRAFCKKHGLSYTSVSFLEANRMILNVLHAAALEARKLKSPSLKDSLLWDGMHAKG